MIISTSQSIAGDVFQYKFTRDSTRYNLAIDSDLRFPQLEGLAQLLNIDSLKNKFDMEIDLLVKSRKGDEGSIVNVKFKQIRSVNIVGDSVFADDNVGWGRIKPGSEFLLLIFANGEITLLNKVNLIAGQQVIDMMQRFMPVFPSEPVETGNIWADTIGFDLELPGQDITRIETSAEYHYLASDEKQGIHTFDYVLDNIPDDNQRLTVDGSGRFNFDNKQGLVLENRGRLTIDAEISLSVFGLPEVLGTTPVHVESEIELVFNSNE
jgi:hypothetical protein